MIETMVLDTLDQSHLNPATPDSRMDSDLFTIPLAISSLLLLGVLGPSSPKDSVKAFISQIMSMAKSLDLAVAQLNLRSTTFTQKLPAALPVLTYLAPVIHKSGVTPTSIPTSISTAISSTWYYMGECSDREILHLPPGVSASNLSDRVAKQKAFSSIFEMSSTEVKSKLHCSGEIVEEQHNETKIIPVKSGKIHSTELQNSFIPLDEKISKSSRKNLVSSKSEASVHATQMNGSSLIPLEHPKSVTATGDDAGFNLISRKKTANKKTNPKSKSKAVVEAAELLISNISDRYKQKDLAKSTRELNQSFSEKSTSLNKSGFSVSK
ncbi:hypothetical protein JD844_019019 [Phrynosoma platyrhinos]|uniref:Uncharacterized protein n=1 Tax=Phrynosoma platyrhinos TaxID=52577 RepID=A0ABQ7SPH8_PHRPL|nr:hypothetical protein JD844_019019 [Phrynosoma platyrhinos]